MLIIEQVPQENGAHRNQIISAGGTIPEGWLPVSPAIEEEAMTLLPFIVIDQVRRGFIIAVSQGEIPEPEPEPEPEPTMEERIASLEAKNAALTTSNQFLEDCLVEMAGVVYA